MTIQGSTIAGNIAQRGANGGGIANVLDGRLTIVNSTIAGNTAVSDAMFGSSVSGGYYVSSSSQGSLTLVNSTVAQNQAIPTNNVGGSGGGFHVASSAVSLLNTIVAANLAGSDPDIQGSVRSLGHNLIGINGTPALTPGPDDLIGTSTAPLNPQLGSLQDNGGSTQTLALLAASPESGPPQGCRRSPGPVHQPGCWLRQLPPVRLCSHWPQSGS